jgi:predicted alpha/beta hydrolase family esterase
MSVRVLTLPGWQNSGPDHWQSLWEQRHGYQRVEQHDWDRPLRGDWIARLDEVLLQSETPAVLVAHSLGCIQVAAWAAHSRYAHRIKAALLVAPGDVEREEIRPQLPSWSPIVLQPLPFKALLLGSQDDPYCSLERARFLAQHWGAAFTDYGACGHINAASGLGDWPEGLELLQNLLN